MTRRRIQTGLLAVLAASLISVACGKKGPPLPPLVLLPVQPADFSAARLGSRVDLTLRIPSANIDRSTPASLERIDIYAWNVPGPVGAEDVVRSGARVGSLAVNPPKEPDEPEPDPKAPVPKPSGFDQNTLATFSDTIPATAGAADAYRAYVAVGVNTRGRRGALSPRLIVPLVAAPPAPALPTMTYDEKAVTLKWAPVVPPGGARPYTYNIYRPPPEASLLTTAPVADASFVDGKIEWDKERCYVVRTVTTVESVRIESDASPARCVTPRDTFAPAKPEGLVGVGSEASISLIWTASVEPDLAGYIVMRAVAPATTLTAVTPTPITDTNFRDTVPAGSRVTYAVQAVDRAGNRSEASNSIVETAR